MRGTKVYHSLQLGYSYSKWTGPVLSNLKQGNQAIGPNKHKTPGYLVLSSSSKQLQATEIVPSLTLNSDFSIIVFLVK